MIFIHKPSSTQTHTPKLTLIHTRPLSSHSRHASRALTMWQHAGCGWCGATKSCVAATSGGASPCSGNCVSNDEASCWKVGPNVTMCPCAYRLCYDVRVDTPLLSLCRLTLPARSGRRLQRDPRMRRLHHRRLRLVPRLLHLLRGYHIGKDLSRAAAFGVLRSRLHPRLARAVPAQELHPADELCVQNSTCLLHTLTLTPQRNLLTRTHSQRTPCTTHNTHRHTTRHSFV